MHYWNPFNQKRKSDEDLSKPDVLERWKRRFKNTELKRKKEERNWARYASIMDDNLWHDQSLSDGSEPSQVNELKACIMSILPYIMLEPPVIDIRAYNETDVQLAAIYENVAKYVDRQYDLFTEFMYACYDALLYGNGIFKLGYWDDVLIDKPLWGSGTTQAFGATKAAYAKQTPLIEIFPDFHARRWSEQRFLIHQIPMHIDDILDNPAYNRKSARKLSPTYSADEVFDFESAPNIDVEHEYVKIQEVHDFRLGRVGIMAEGLDEWLYFDAEPYNIVPYENLTFWPRPKSVWGDSLTQSIEKHIKELSEMTTYMSRTVAKEALLKVLYNPAMIGENLARLEDKSDSFVPVLGDDLAKALHVVDYGTAQSQYAFHMGIAQLEERIRGISGVTAQQRGSHEAGVETAVEANMLQSASDVRNTMRQRMFSRFASRSISKLLYVITLEYPAERIAEMAGLDSSWAWMIRAAGPFDATKFNVDYGMTAVNARQERLQKLVMFKNLVGDYLNPVVLAKMAADILDFDFVDEMMVYQALGMGGAQGSSNTQVQNSAEAVAGTRVDGGSPQPMEVLQGLGNQ